MSLPHQEMQEADAMIQTSAKQKHRKMLREMGDRAFAGHTLKKETEGSEFPQMFICRTPGTTSYWFRVVFVPGQVIIVGDIGSQVYRCSDKDSLAWLVRCVLHDLDYVLGKAEHKEHEFNEESAREYLAQQVKEYPDYAKTAAKILKSFEEYHDDALDDQVSWLRACMDNGHDDPPYCKDFSSQMLWQGMGLQKFAELYKAQFVKDAPQPQEAAS